MRQVLIVVALLGASACELEGDRDARSDDGALPEAVSAWSTGKGALKIWNTNTHFASFGDFTDGGGTTDIRNLLHYMAQESHKPDLILLQEVKDGVTKHRCSELRDALVSYLGDPSYACLSFSTLYGGPAMIYKSNRLAYVTHSGITGHRRSAAGTCAADPSAMQPLAARFKDLASGKFVNAASLHLSLDANACIEGTFDAIERRFDAFGGAAMSVIGGDTNYGEYSGGYRPWYTRVTSGLRYGDAIYQACGGRRGCIQDNWTRSNIRIDFLFARPSKFADSYTKTVWYSRAHGVSAHDYADHKAQTAINYY